MPESELIARQRRILSDVAQLVVARDDDRAEKELAAKLGVLEAEFREAGEALRGGHDAELASAEEAFQAERQRVTSAVQKAIDEVQSTYRQVTEQALAECEKERAAAEHDCENSLFEIAGMSEAGENGLKSKYGDIEGGTDSTAAGIESRRAEAKRLLKLHRKAAYADRPTPAVNPLPANVDPRQAISETFKVADERLKELAALKSPKWCGFGTLVMFFLFFAAAFAAGAWFATKGDPIMTAAVGGGGGLVLSFLIWIIIRSTAAGHVWAGYAAVAYALDTCELARQLWRRKAGEAYKKEHAALLKRRQHDDAKAEETRAMRIAQANATRDDIAKKAKDKLDRNLAELTRRRDVALEKNESQIKPKRVEVPKRRDEGLRQIAEKHRQSLEAARGAVADERRRRVEQWRRELARIEAESDDIAQECARWFPDWNGLMSDAWKPTTTPPPVIQLGRWEVGPRQFIEEKPRDDHTPVELDALAGMGRPDEEADHEHDIGKLPVIRQPALVTFPDQSSLLFKAQGASRDRAVEIMQSAMLRLATTVPPGKVRFTVIDPIGLGQNFAAFMHLADYDEQLIGARIWTESAQIETRLADLTEQMEVVIQKYLRNEFETIEAYNAEAGEVAEPYRFLVVANFPANFTEASARRLVSIVSSGPRCGVHCLISVDTKQPMPPGFKMADIEQNCVNFVWQDQKFAWKEAEFGRLPLSLDQPPNVELFSEIVKRVGVSAKDASRVEVPFSMIAPKPEIWWTGDTRGGIRVALGPAGATKHQHLELGKGTSQHVLVAGKTGSGKSTLLHTLITNLALLYSPDEIELYLVDFKKGVEFKNYATHALPHARVVSVESDREFGLSVLERLDAELRSRGERFRDTGAQDVAGYRKATGEKLPRIMLIIDEFQEFFVEDDKLAQQVGLLFDRLVRQGRAFGVHVLLGSQTLGGAYSLARTTLGQMGVRIALQCSDADAHLILSEENMAARLLSRPGEAIYNDAGGLPDANHPFQVAYLSDGVKEQYLEKLRDFARAKNGDVTYPQIVFEGNVPGQLDKNTRLDELLRADGWPAASAKPAACWLGDPVAIKDPSAALLRRQSGCNLLLIGQNDLQAGGILAAGLISLAAQYPPSAPNGQESNGDATSDQASRPATQVPRRKPPVDDASDPETAVAGAERQRCPAATNGQGGTRFFILDGTLPEAKNAGYFARLAAALPHETLVAVPRDTAAALNVVAQEVARRQQAGQTDAPPWYLVIYDLQRFRDLRKKEDDFGFSRGGEGEVANPSQQLTTILREGPVLGINTLVWCDTLNNLQRTFDRQVMKELELKVLFQMSANDSSSLIDSPIANRLGEQRALYFCEGENVLEKFRPYDLPPEEWLAWVERQLHSRQPAVAT
ncbi:MAG TPA: FtsK/SpoIIIE domain-containing protein [Pirellulales bacterium]|nr:FtsK/SpoIIIE domain-containing protein [Pirellulales bacterium]